MKPAHEMTLAEFAEAMKPNGSVSRLPQIGQSQDVLIYQTYMNGELASALPEDAQEFKHSDVLLHRLTEKLGLDSDNFRDNLKVAEVVALRSAYMTAILHATVRNFDREGTQLSEIVTDEYETLADKGTFWISHPWVKQQIEAQKAHTQKLQPLLDQASAIVGSPVSDRAPDELSRGRIVSQNGDFTAQELDAGQVAIHDNKYLQSIPQVGDDVTITYYRGYGQVFENTQDIELSAPYLDPKNNDLAILAKDRGTGKEQVVVFRGIKAFSTFVEAEGLSPELVEKGMDVLSAKPRISSKEKSPRTPVADITVDAQTGALALDYTENNIRYTALFSDAAELARLAPEFGMNGKEVEAAHRLEGRIALFGGNKVAQTEKSFREAKEVAMKLCDSASKANEKNGCYIGPVVGETSLHVIQDVGRRTAVIHEKVNLDKVPAISQKLSVSYGEGRAKVEIRTPGASLGR